MVLVVLAGGSGNVGREVLAELVAQGKHQVIVFSRNGSPELTAEGINVVEVDYLNKAKLVTALKDVHTVLSFLVSDPENKGQLNLIDSCVEAGVKRFAPSEWGAASNSGFPATAFKDQVYSYLKFINAAKPVLEFCRFQTGLFMNYVVYPHVTAKTLFITCLEIDVKEGQAIMVEDGEDYRVYTTIQDVAKMVAAAIDYEKWPETGGMVGSRIKMKDLIKVVEKYAGRPFTIHNLKKADLAKGKFNSPWIPPFEHPHLPAAMRSPEARKVIMCAFENAVSINEVMDVSPTWNRLLPDFKFTDIESFVKESLDGN